MENTNYKIFLVDDDIFHLNMTEQILRDSGQTDITLFENGVDCLNALHLEPEVIFLDHNMDNYTGYEVLRKIKRYNPNIFVVMVSSQEEIKTAVLSLKYGAFDYLEKDTRLSENLKTTLKKINEMKALLKERKPSLIKQVLKYI